MIPCIRFPLRALEGSVFLHFLILLVLPFTLAGAFAEADDFSSPCGIYALDSQKGTKNSQGQSFRNANIRDYPFVAGYALRRSWSELEPVQGVYDFSLLDPVIQKLEAQGKQLTLALVTAPEPSYIAAMPGVTTWLWRDPDQGTVTPRAVPWDPFVRKRFGAFMTALGNHLVPTMSGHSVPFRDHPVLASIRPPIAGLGHIRDPYETVIANLPGYTRTKFQEAVLDDLRAVADSFLNKSSMIGFWKVQDGISSPTLWQRLRTLILAEFDGINRPMVGFFQENLAASRDALTDEVSGSPTPNYAAPLYQSRNSTYIALQALQGWNQPFANPDKTANAVPRDGLDYAYQTFNSGYVELYVADLDDPAYWASFQDWHDAVCPQP
jgi:hypothetical protein